MIKKVFLLFVMIFSLRSPVFALSDEEYKIINSVVQRLYKRTGVERVMLKSGDCVVAQGLGIYDTSNKIQKKEAYSMALMRAKDDMARLLNGSVSSMSRDFTNSTTNSTVQTNGKDSFRSAIIYDVHDDIEDQTIYVTIIDLSPMEIIEELKKTAGNVLDYLSSGDKYIAVDADSESNTFAGALGDAYEYAVWFILKDIKGLPADTFFAKTLFLHALSNGVFTNVTDLDFSTEITETIEMNKYEFEKSVNKTKIKMRVFIDREKFKESVLYALNALNPKNYGQFTSEFNANEEFNGRIIFNKELNKVTEESSTLISSWRESGVLKNLFQIEHSNNDLLEVNNSHGGQK